MTDCMDLAAQPHVSLIARSRRALHGLGHSHTKPAVRVAPVAQVCAVPELETVTVSTVSLPPGFELSPPGLTTETFMGGFRQEWPVPALPDHSPLRAPEISPEGLLTTIMLLAGVWAILSDGRGRK